MRCSTARAHLLFGTDALLLSEYEQPFTNLSKLSLASGLS